MGDGTALRGVTMTLHTHCRGPVRVLDAPDGHDVIIEGRLDVHTVPDIRDAIHAVIIAGSGELRLHLGDAEIGDATGLGVIVHLHRRATRAERRLLLLDASDRTTRLLRGCRLERILAPRHGPRDAAPCADCGASHRLSASPPPAAPPLPSSHVFDGEHAARRAARVTPDRPWVMRTYAGHSSAAASNALYRRNLAKGQTGLSVAFDLPTQTGYDPDHVARARRGRQGRRADQPHRRHGGALRRHPAARDEHLDDDQRDGDVAARALPGRGRAPGRGRR